MANKRVTVKPTGGTYTTLQAAITGEVTANANLVTMGGILTISIEGDWSGTTDTTAVNITGFTTDSTHYVNIITDSRNKFAGAYTTDKYKLVVSSGYTACTNTQNYTRITGIQIKNIEIYDAEPLMAPVGEESLDWIGKFEPGRLDISGTPFEN